ncbi:MAG: glycosyltransferase [Bacteroidetes bacterium]|nr:glycosyltransferase [Bacteroidota bacterium]
MEKKKYAVIQVIDQLHAGGAERVLVGWANILSEKGHSSAVLTTVSPGILRKDIHQEVSFFNLNRQWKWNPFAMYRMIQILKKYDIIHVHSSHNLRYVWLAAKLFRLHKPLFFHEHFYFEKISWHRRIIYPKTMMICVSKFVRDWAIQNQLSTEKKAFLLPNIILPQKIDIISNTARKTNSIIQIVTTGNIAPRKNYEFILEVFKELKKQLFENFHLTIIGSVADKKYFHYIQNKILLDGLEKQVEFIHDCANIQPILHQFDIALHASKFETGPLVLIEYLAKKIPFLTFQTGQVSEQIKNELPEFVLEHYDPILWVSAIQKIISADKKLLHKRMESVFEKNFSVDQYYAKGMHIYSQGFPE